MDPLPPNLLRRGVRPGTEPTAGAAGAAEPGGRLWTSLGTSGGRRGEDLRIGLWTDSRQCNY